MIKGVNRQIIEINNTGNLYYETLLYGCLGILL